MQPVSGVTILLIFKIQDASLKTFILFSYFKRKMVEFNFFLKPFSPFLIFTFITDKCIIFKIL